MDIEQLPPDIKDIALKAIKNNDQEMIKKFSDNGFDLSNKPQSTAKTVGGGLLSIASKVAPVAGQYIGGIAQGAAEALNPAAIPRGIETLGRAIFTESGNPLQRLSKAEEHSIIPAPTIGEQAAGIRALPSLLPGGKSYLDTLKEEQNIQKEYEGGLKGQALGQIAAIAPSLLSLVKSGGKIVAKTISKSPGLVGSIENFVTKSGIRAGRGERIVQQGVANAEELKDFKTVGDTYLYSKAQQLGKVTEDYAAFRNANYEQAITPLLESKGKTKIPVEETRKSIYEAMGEAKSLSGKLVKYLENLQEDLKDKDTIDFSKANDIKKHIMNTFGGFKKANYVGMTPDDARAARNIVFRLLDAIDQNVPELAPI